MFSRMKCVCQRHSTEGEKRGEKNVHSCDRQIASSKMSFPLLLLRGINKVAFNLFTLDSSLPPFLRCFLHTLNNFHFFFRLSSLSLSSMMLDKNLLKEAIINYALSKWWHKHDSFLWKEVIERQLLTCPPHKKALIRKQVDRSICSHLQQKIC